MKKSPIKTTTKKNFPDDSTIAIPFTFQNLNNHFEHTFDLWCIKTPSIKTQIHRCIIFLSALIATIFWPIHDLIVEATILILTWLLLSLTEKPVPRFLLMLNLMLNIAFLFYLMKLITPAN